MVSVESDLRSIGVMMITKYDRDSVLPKILFRVHVDDVDDVGVSHRNS